MSIISDFSPYQPTETERRLLGILLRSEGVTMAQMTSRLDVAQPSVSRIVSNLVDKGLIELGPRLAKGRGQPSPFLGLKPSYALALGVAILGDRLALVVLDFCGKSLWSRALHPSGMRRDSVLMALRDALASLRSDTGIDPALIRVTGVGLSAFFVGEGNLMNPPDLLDDWALIDVAAEIAEVTGTPTFVDNDGNAACIGEGLFGVGRHTRNFAYFQITNGFGGGIVIDGRCHRGAFGNAGEFGALCLGAGLESPSLERLRYHLGQSDLCFDSVGEMLGKLPDLSHPGVASWIEEAVRGLSLAATAAACVLDCQAIVLGGRLPRSLAEVLAERITIAHTARRGRPLPMPTVMPAQAPGDAVATGAAAMAFQNTFFV
jgi:predicted NBD/HSP70 family sugar kinase